MVTSNAACDVEVIGRSVPARRVRLTRHIRLQLGDFMHQLHHRFIDCNYGTHEDPWDRIFGSFHDGTPEADARIREHRIRMHAGRGRPPGERAEGHDPDREHEETMSGARRR